MKITWKLCLEYKDACNYTGVIYLHEWYGNPFYWGKAHKSFFGGHMRKHNESKMSGRYNSGYMHWIEGCLRHGANLYIGELDTESLKSISEIESYLISAYPSEMNKRKPIFKELSIIHDGEIPRSITNNKLSNMATSHL